MVSHSSLDMIVSAHTIVRKTRLLPVPGEVRVSKGADVEPGTAVAYAEVPGYPMPLNVAVRLGVEPAEIEGLMVKKIGDPLEVGEPLARKKLFLWLADDIVKAPFAGTIESVSTQTGMVVMRSHPVPVTTRAHISGKVVEVMEGEGVVIETPAALVQGIFGIGGEREGSLHLSVESRHDVLDAARLTPAMKGKVVVGGGLVTLDAVKKALNLGIQGIIAGGINDKDLSAFLGYDIGLVITGQEHFGLSLIVTEGFGEVSMAEHTFNLLKSLNGHLASINGTTHIRAGVTRPEIIVPREAFDIREQADTPTELAVGCSVRVIRYPYFGQEAKLLEIVENVTLPSEVEARAGKILLSDGTTLSIPLANLEPLTTRKPV